MNNTEEKALEWLLNIKKYDVKQVKYSRSSSPDFIIDNGMGYEVKTIFHHSIGFTDKQYINLPLFGQGEILVFSDEVKPEYIIPFSYLVNRPNKFQDLNIHYRASVFPIPDNDLRLLRNIARKYIRENPHLNYLRELRNMKNTYLLIKAQQLSRRPHYNRYIY